MREILFRGKRVDTGTWVQGYYFKIWDEHYICWGTTNGEVDKLLVIPETIGQDTGLRDKNGKKIFEGDILHKEFFSGWYAKFEDGAFCRFPNDDIQRNNWEHYRMNQNGTEVWKVIGNVHDNPELVGARE